MWVVSFAKYPETCCLEPHLNGLLLTIFFGLSTILALSAAGSWWMLATRESALLWLSGFLWLADAFILVCVTSFTLFATQDAWPNAVPTQERHHRSPVLPPVAVANPVAAAE